MIVEAQWSRDGKMIDDVQIEARDFKSGARMLVIGRWPAGANEVWIRDATGDAAALKEALRAE